MSNTSYKTIQEISEKLLSSLATAGVVLTEAQKSDVDTFMHAIEAKLEEQKTAAIKATKVVVERRMDDEYRKVFESILKHQDVYNRLLEKIAVAQATKKISEEMADKVDEFIGEKIEECIPDEAIVDYDRLQNLEKTIALLKETLMLNDSDVKNAISETEKRISESYSKKEAVLRRNLLDTRGKLRAALTESKNLKQEQERAEAARLLEEKTADLPAYEADKIKKQLAGKSTEEIKARFNAVYESVAGQVVEDAKLSLESEINDILANEAEEAGKKDKKTCGKKPETDGDSGESSDGSEVDDEASVDESKLIDESIDMIDSGMMLDWMAKSESINMRLF